MPTFRFRLETLLQIRKSERDQRRSELSQALQAERVLAERADGVRQDQEELRRLSRYSSQPGQIVVDDLLGNKRYELQLRAELETLATQRGQIDEEIERRRELLVEADRRVSVLEKLREKKAIRYQQEEDQQEQKTIDEAALLGALRREVC